MQGWQVAPPIEKYYNLFRQACQFPYNQSRLQPLLCVLNCGWSSFAYNNQDLSKQDFQRYMRDYESLSSLFCATEHIVEKYTSPRVALFLRSNIAQHEH